MDSGEMEQDIDQAQNCRLRSFKTASYGEKHADVVYVYQLFSGVEYLFLVIYHTRNSLKMM